MPLIDIGRDTQAILVSGTQPISGNGANITLVPSRAGSRPIITHLFIEAAPGATDLTIKSYTGAADTNLTGPIAADTTANMEWGGMGVAVFIGDAIGDSIRMGNSGTQQLEGFVVYTYSAF